ncbi:MAG: HAD family hydrolase [Desulfobacterales bacterium]|jgi:putative hydrolase of the HAD superfamily
MVPRAEIEAYLTPLVPAPCGIEPGGCLRAPVRSILFDIYGTLFISGSGDIGVARQQAKEADLAALLQRFDVPLSPQALSERFFLQIEASHEKSTKEGVDFPEVEIDRIWMAVLGTEDRDRARRFATAYELIVNPVYPMPGLDRTLAGCREKGLVLGLVSNAQFFTPWLFPWFLGQPAGDLGFTPDLQIFSYRLGRAKPSIVLFETAAHQLAKREIAPGEALFVGNDMRNDVAAAKQAGFQTALFAGDARSLRLREDDSACRDVTPDVVITELVQILEYL